VLGLGVGLGAALWPQLDPFTETSDADHGSNTTDDDGVRLDPEHEACRARIWRECLHDCLFDSQIDLPADGGALAGVGVGWAVGRQAKECATPCLAHRWPLAEYHCRNLPAPYPDPERLARARNSTDLAERMVSLVTDVECSRGHRFENVPVVRRGTRDGFRTFAAGLPRDPEADARIDRLLHALRLLPRDRSYRETLVAAMGDQVLAYWDHEVGEIVVVSELSREIMDGIIAHELAHAVQQEKGDLERYLRDDYSSLDAQLAASFVVEGEASLVAAAFSVGSTAVGQFGEWATIVKPCHIPEYRIGMPPRLIWPAVKPTLDLLANMTREQMLEMTAASLAEAVDVEAVRRLPQIFYQVTTAPYLHGPRAVYVRFHESSFQWSAVDELRRAPPAATTLVLHPAYLAANRTFEPLEPGGRSPGRGWVGDSTDQVGELAILALFMEHGVAEEDARDAAAGWNGGAIRVYSRDDDLAFRWATRWDTPDDARAFRRAWLDILDRRAGAAITWENGSPDAATEKGSARYTWSDDAGPHSGSMRWKKDLVWIEEQTT
jgi:hypothetical protein